MRLATLCGNVMTTSEEEQALLCSFDLFEYALMLGLPGQTYIDVDVGNPRTIHHHRIRGDDDKTPK